MNALNKITSANPDFVVRYRFPLYISFVTWAIGWIILYKCVTSTEALPKNSPGFWFDVLFWVLVASVNGLLGPICAMKYSLRVFVLGKQLTVKRYFGLVAKTSLVENVVRFDITANAKDGTSAVQVLFSNGDRLNVSQYAFRFQEFYDYLAKPKN